MHAFLAQLLAQTEGPFVSLIVPLTVGSRQRRENAALLRNALKVAERKLVLAGLSERGSAQFLAAGEEYIEHSLQQLATEQTLCMYFAPNLFITRLLPSVEQQIVIVGEYFHVTPLLHHLYGSSHYGVLAVSKRTVRFLEINGDDLQQLVLPQLPLSLADRTVADHRETLQSHSSGSGTSMFHGQGGAKDRMEGDLTLYLLKIAHALKQALGGREFPVVFAGVKELFSIYRTLDQSGCLCPEFVRGSPDRVTDHELIERARSIAEETEELRSAAFLVTYERATSSTKTTTDLSTVLAASIQGKVECLLLARGATQWGMVDGTSGAMTLQSSTEDGGIDLIGACVFHVLKHSGHVALLDLAKMPQQSPVAAVLRQ